LQNIFTFDLDILPHAMKTYLNTIQKATVTALLLLFFTSMFFSFTSCLFEKSKDEPCKYGDTPINRIEDLHKSRISMYTGNDKLTFINTTTNQEQTYQSNGIETYYTIVDQSDPDEKCRRNYKYECKRITFYSSDSSDKLTVLINLASRTTFRQIYINMKKNGYDYPITFFNSAGHLDSITIQNKTYHNVFKIITRGQERNFDKWYVYYTLNEGIIRVKLINGEIWDLKDKQ
jgi:hypothetical protein